MKALKRTITIVLLVVAALTALRAPAFANGGQLRMAAQACHCHDGCAPNSNTCKAQGSCTATCGATSVVADIGFAVFAPQTTQRTSSGRIAVLNTLTHPPPLQPPRA